MERCEKLKDFMKCQQEIIGRHLDEHKWLNQIEDQNKAACDFIKKYGWLMREEYCLYCCTERDNCKLEKITLVTKKEKK